MASRKDVLQRRTGLRDEILQERSDGRLKPGDMLPPVRELAARHGLSHRVVFQEIQKLAQTGLLETVPRVGVFLREAQTIEVPATANTSFMGHAIGVIGMSDVKSGIWRDQQTGWSAFVATGAIMAIQNIATEGYHTIIMNPDRLCAEVVERLADDPPYGIVIGELNHLEQNLRWANEFATQGIPVVVSSNDPALAGYDRAVHDHEAGSYDLTRWMLVQGRRHILNVWATPATECGATEYWYADRQRGYERAMREAGLAPLPAILAPFTATEGDAEALQRSARQLAGYLVEHITGPHRADALLLASDAFVAETATALRFFGLRAGEDVLLGGYDAYWKESFLRGVEDTAPSVTIDKCNPALGAESVRLLLARQEGVLPAHPQCRIVPHKVIAIEN